MGRILKKLPAAYNQISADLCREFSYVKLSLGRHDPYRDHLRRFYRHMSDITNAAIDSSKEAVTLCITMMGVVSMWMGLMQIAAKGGVIASASRRLRPLIRFLFPNLPSGHPAEEYITTNFIANFLGLGWAATPAGLKAMEALGQLEDERRRGRLAGPRPSRRHRQQ